MDNFEFNISACRVIFGSGSIGKLPDEIYRLSRSRPLLISTPNALHRLEVLAATLRDALLHPAGCFSEATMHTPTHVTDKAIDYLKQCKADCIVSFGGGSTIGLGKAVCLRTGLVHICIPTTYAGSEMTPILGETTNGMKTTQTDPKILPNTVIYDVEFTATLPPELSATSGVNAIAHAVEALYAQTKNPIINIFALEGIKALAESLPAIVDAPKDMAARSKAQYGAWLCGICLGSVGMALHHKLCHTLGGSFNLPHAQTHTIVLPHALAYNAPEIPDVMTKIASVLPDSHGNAIEGLNVLLSRLRVEKSLKAFGMSEDDIAKAADIALSRPYWNPRMIEKNKLQEVIRRCWAGEEARVDL